MLVHAGCVTRTIGGTRAQCARLPAPVSIRTVAIPVSSYVDRSAVVARTWCKVSACPAATPLLSSASGGFHDSHRGSVLSLLLSSTREISNWTSC